MERKDLVVPVGDPKGHPDRGPFGGGELVKYRGRSDSESESFQDAPADRKASNQLKLAGYAKKKPGRLASRMLLKMVKESAHGSVGAIVNDPNPTPPAADGPDTSDGDSAQSEDSSGAEDDLDPSEGGVDPSEGWEFNFSCFLKWAVVTLESSVISLREGLIQFRAHYTSQRL